MPFSEKIKREVKQKAAFRCCRYQNIGIDIHHIIPERDGGFISITYFGKISHTKEGVVRYVYFI